MICSVTEAENRAAPSALRLLTAPERTRQSAESSSRASESRV